MAKDTNKTAAVDVAALLASTDLVELNKQIGQREDAIKKIEGEIYSLKLVRRSVEAFKNGKPAKNWSRKPKKTAADSPAPPPPPAPQGGTAQNGIEPVVRIKRFLDGVGAAGVPAIARETGLTQAIVAATLQERHDAFISKPGGIWKLR